MSERKIRKYWEKKILCETGFKVGYLFGYIYLYKKMAMECCTFCKWICDRNNHGAPLLFSSYEDAYSCAKDENYFTSFQ